MKTLVLWGEAPLAGAKARAAEGARVLLFGRSAAEGDGTVRAADLGPGAARILGAVTEWASALGERPGTGERSFAELFAWNEVPLWPYLHRFFLSPQSASGQWVRLAESFSFLFETELPDEVEAVGLGADETTLLERCCTARGVLFQGESKKRAARAAVGPSPWACGSACAAGGAPSAQTSRRRRRAPSCSSRRRRAPPRSARPSSACCAWPERT